MSEKYKKTEKLYEIKEKYGVADDDIVFAILEANNEFLKNLNQAYEMSKNHDEIIKTINKNLKTINARRIKTNILLAISVAFVSFFGGVFFSMSPTVNNMLVSYQIKKYNESIKLKNEYNTKLSQLQQKNKEKVDALIEDFEIQKIELQAEKNKAISQYKNLKANNSITRKLRELDVKLKLHKNKNDGIYTLYIDNEDRSIYIPSSSNNNISFKPND